MNIEKLADRLAYYNEWRRGMDGKQPHPVELGADIDEAVSALREIASLRAELESARVDAERYRWLRDKVENQDLVIAKVGSWSLESWSGDSPDAAIDAARGGK